MDQNDIEGMIVVARPFDHGLEFMALVVGRGFTEVGIFGDDSEVAGVGPIRQLTALVWHREIAVHLPPCRDAQIETNAERFRNQWVYDGDGHGLYSISYDAI